jgi:hypothetical protein
MAAIGISLYACEKKEEKAARAAAEAEQAAEQKATPETISVSNAREFLQALGSNRIVELKPGRYNLSEHAPNLSLSKGVSWSGGLYFHNIHNLTIRGMHGGVSEIVIESRSNAVMDFSNSSNIIIENITAGHTESIEECGAGVLSFNESSQIAITGANLYGSGRNGLDLTNVHNMKVTDSQIYECTSEILYASGGSDISFENCLFHDNAGGVAVHQTSNVTFNNCEFKNNEDYAFYVFNTTVSVLNSNFLGYESDSVVKDNGSGNVEFTGCKFEGRLEAESAKNKALVVTALASCEEKGECGVITYYKDRAVVFWDLTSKETEEVMAGYSDEEMNEVASDIGWYNYHAWEFLDKIGEKYVSDTAKYLGFILQSGDTVVIAKNGGGIVLFDGKAKFVRTGADAISDSEFPYNEYPWFFKKKSNKKEN